MTAATLKFVLRVIKKKKNQNSAVLGVPEKTGIWCIISYSKKITREWSSAIRNEKVVFINVLPKIQ